MMYLFLWLLNTQLLDSTSKKMPLSKPSNNNRRFKLSEVSTREGFYTFYVVWESRLQIEGKWKNKKRCKAYQEVVMPFLEPIVYPTKRNKGNIKETIYIWNILRSWSEKMAKKRKINPILQKVKASQSIDSDDSTHSLLRWSRILRNQELQAGA